MSEKDEKATPPVIPTAPTAPVIPPPVVPTIPSPLTTPAKVLVRELKREPAALGERAGSVTWEQPTALQTRQYPLWYRYRAAFGSLIIVNVCIGTYMLFTVKPKPKGSKKGKALSVNRSAIFSRWLLESTGSRSID
ncbi:hypothetical protein M758_5G069400 [Ceratodon purpureus]|nr:hypothetical protein M758_5G069400 [Ceratodon purpureus]